MDLRHATSGLRRIAAEYPGAREGVDAFVERLIHDLNNPLGTLALELFNLGAVTGELSERLAAGDLPGARAAAAELKDIQENLERAREQNKAIVDELHGDLAVGVPR